VATQYFRRATSAQLTTKFKPTIARETEKLQLASVYDKYAGKAAELRPGQQAGRRPQRLR